MESQLLIFSGLAETVCLPHAEWSWEVRWTGGM